MKVLTLTDNQARLISEALELYCRIGLGQFDYIQNHPTIDYNISKRNVDFHKDIEPSLTISRNRIFGLKRGFETSLGIFHIDVDETCRIAHDIHQIIRHEFWKQNPNRLTSVVDSSIHFTSKDEDIRKVKINPLDDENDIGNKQERLSGMDQL